MCGLGVLALGCLGLASDKVAIVIGVNQYSDASIAPLRFAKADAVEVSSVLTTNGWDVITITTDESGSTGSATASGIQAALKQVAKRGKLDSFIFYFCGHGFSNSKKVGYLALGDTTLSNLESTALAIPSLIDASGTIDATHKSYFFDACRNVPGRAIGIETKKMDKDLFESFRSLSEETSAAVFLSCKQGELSYENSELKHGVFTSAVLEGLRGEAAVEGTVTSDSLKSYVSKRVPEIEKAQTPWAFVSGSAPAEYSKGSKSAGKVAKPAVKQGYTLVKFINSMKDELKTESITVRIDGKRTEVIDESLIYIPVGKHEVEIELKNNCKLTKRPTDKDVSRSFLERVVLKFTFQFQPTTELIDLEFRGRIREKQTWTHARAREGASFQPGGFFLERAELLLDGKNAKPRISE